jgi:hypothetical protein
MGSTIPPEVLASMPLRRGTITGGDPDFMIQEHGAVLSQLVALREEVAELRRLLSPPVGAILTGPEVRAIFDRLQGGDRGYYDLPAITATITSAEAQMKVK